MLPHESHLRKFHEGLFDHRFVTTLSNTVLIALSTEGQTLGFISTESGLHLLDIVSGPYHYFFKM